MTPLDFDWSVDPACSLGYSGQQLQAELGNLYLAFEKYMLMKAHPICKGPGAAAPSTGPRSSCSEAHGDVYYLHDVLRFVEHHGLGGGSHRQ